MKRISMKMQKGVRRDWSRDSKQRYNIQEEVRSDHVGNMSKTEPLET